VYNIDGVHCGGYPRCGPLVLKKNNILLGRLCWIVEWKGYIHRIRC
jgi:hypothetical protein